MPDKSLLLEIGVEEVPARFIPGAMRDIKAITESVLASFNIEYSNITSYATPRRLAVVVHGLPETQPDRTREVFGPPKQAAFNPDGSYTQAALGFARTQGVNPDKLVLKPKGKGEYIAAVIEDKGRPVAEVLKDALPKIVLSIGFPKSMRWGDGSIRFVRPIHNITAVFDNQAIEFEIEGIKSGNTTTGHRFLSPERFALKSADEYAEELKKRFVLVDPNDRMKSIKEQAESLAAKVDGVPVFDDEKLSIVACLVEYPACVLCGFSDEYLKLPDELLTAVMVGHQKYFPVKSKSGNGLINSFIVVSNTRPENESVVRAGAERVIRARFEDARFYFEEDVKIRPQDRLDDLKKVTFQVKLGSTYDKTMRVKSVAKEIASALYPAKIAAASNAADISKTDLITGVVREFPELQGIMGMYYARHFNETNELAEALREQYLPAFSGDKVPVTETGTVLSLSDRMDNIASFFSIGLKPSGSEDPFALRRQALGVISILAEKGIGISIAGMYDMAAKNISAIKGAKDAKSDVMQFFEQRIEGILQGKGHAFDVIQSTLGYCTVEPYKTFLDRVDAVAAFKSMSGYNEFLVAIKRVKNIMPKADVPAVDPSLFKTDEERALFDAYKSVTSVVELHASKAEFKDALVVLQVLTKPITVFFDKVLVMDKDEAVKNNRLSLLKDVWALAALAADFSKLQETA